MPSHTNDTSDPDRLARDRGERLACFPEFRENSEKRTFEVRPATRLEIRRRLSGPEDFYSRRLRIIGNDGPIYLPSWSFTE